MKRLLADGTSISLCALAVAIGTPAIAQETQPDETVSQGANDQDEIIVEGVRASIGNSLDTKRNSDTIIDVLSADDSDRFPDQNIAEGLARIPGISFQRDNDTGDGEFISIRGLDATYNTVLNDGIRVATADTFRRSALNVITGTGISRIEVTKVPLPEHASEGIGGTVDVVTLGALDRRSGFTLFSEFVEDSFADNDGFRIGGEATFDLADNFAFNVNASFRRRFFQNFQINPATVVPEILFPQTFTAADGSSLVFDDADDIEDVFDLIPTDFLDISNFTTEQTDYEFADVRDDTFNISGTLDWQATDTTRFTLGGRYSRGNRQETISNIEFDADPDDFVDGSLVPGGTPGQLIRSFRDPEVAFEGQIEDELEIQQTYFLRGETVLDQWTFDYVVGFSRATRNDPTLSIDFFQEFEDIPGSPGTNAASERAVSFAPFVLGGPFISPNPFDQDIFLAGIDPFCSDPSNVDSDQFQTGTCGELIDFDEELEDRSVAERFSARFDITRNFASDVLEYIRLGGLFEDSRTTETRIDLADVDDDLAAILTGIVDQNGDPDNSPGTLGVITDQIRSFDPIGNPFADIGFNGIPLFDRAGLLNIRSAFRDGFITSGAEPLVDEFLQADETIYAGYLQSKLILAERLSLIGGVRFEYYDARFDSPSVFEGDIDFQPDAADDTTADSVPLAQGVQSQAINLTDNFEVLPRFLLNYDWSERFRTRFGYSTSFSRPTFDLLLGSFDGNLGVQLADGVALADATTADVEQVNANFSFGNPNLRNSYAHNFDVSFEYYWNRQNALSVAFFYKSISDFLFTTFATDIDVSTQTGLAPDQTIGQILAGVNLTNQGQQLVTQLGGIETLLATPGAQLAIAQPANGDRAEVYGVEIGFAHTFDYLPGLLSNLGLIANLTLQDTKTDLTLGTLNDEDILVQIGEAQAGDQLVQSFQFFNSPNVIGNAVLYYDDRTIDANLSYRFTGTQLEEIEAFGISQFQQGRGILDFDFEYTIRDLGPIGRLALTFEARDLTDSGRRFSVFETRGRGEEFSDLATFNGRSFTFGARVRF